MFDPSPETRAAISSRVDEYLGTLLSDSFALRGQQLRGGGVVAEFEYVLGERCGFPHCLSTPNATTGVLLTVLASGLEKKTVLVDRNAWVGSLGALEVGRANIRVESLATFLADPFEIVPGSVAAVLASDERGKRHDMKLVRSFCDRYACLYLEDTDRLPGITCPRDECSLADVQILSFGPGKPLCLGEGGAFLCRDRRLFERAIMLSQHPERLDRERITATCRPLINARIHPLSALIGSSLLRAIGNDGK